jgi:hypothetical protein
VLGLAAARDPGAEVLGAGEVAHDGGRDADFPFVQQLPGGLDAVAGGDGIHPEQVAQHLLWTDLA